MVLHTWTLDRNPSLGLMTNKTQTGICEGSVPTLQGEHRLVVPYLQRKQTNGTHRKESTPFLGAAVKHHKASYSGEACGGGP